MWSHIRTLAGVPHHNSIRPLSCDDLIYQTPTEISEVLANTYAHICSDNTLNFLDLTISLKTFPLNSQFHVQINSTPLPLLNQPHSQNSQLGSPEPVLHPHFSIYRKPSDSGVLIHGDSFHLYSHKMAAFNSMIRRLVSVPLSQSAFQAECIAISDLAKKNNIQVAVRKIVRRKLLRIAMKSVSYLSNSNSSERKRWVRILF